MPLSPSRVLKRVRAGQLATVLKINLSDPRGTEIAGLMGVDAVWFCNEHVPNDWIGLEHQIRAARIHHVDALVRVSRGSYSDYIRPIEAGAAGIIVPHVASEAEARQIIEWVRFHPLGKRPLDGGNVDGRFCLVPTDAYLKHGNEEVVVIMQIESPEALEQVERIAAVPGLSGLLFGPGDFCHRIGRPDQVDLPEVVAARQRVAAAAVKNGLFAMTAGLFAPFNDLVAEGHTVINIGADVVGLGEYVRQRLDLVSQYSAQLPEKLRPKAHSPYG